MRTLRFAAIFVLTLFAATAHAQQTTNVTASLQDPSGTVWANASWTANVISSLNPPVTFPGYNTFNPQWVGTADLSGHFAVTVQAVAHIYPANSTWQFCVVSGISFTQQFCVNIPVGDSGQTDQDISAQINAVLTPPVVNGGFEIRAYNDMEVTGYPGAMYYNIISNTFRCYTLTWGPCSVGSGATTPATMLVLKGGGTTNAVLPAIPGVDYVIPSGSITGTAANLSGTPNLPNGTTAITQNIGDVSNLLATDRFVANALAGIAVAPTTPLVLKGNNAGGIVAAVPGTDYLIPLASANVLGSNGSGVLQSATSAQIVNALNISPSVTLSTVLFPFYAQPGDTIASIEAQCASAACTYIVAIPQTFTLSGNHTLSSNVNPAFLAAGKWTVNGSSDTLTIPGHVEGTLTQHFAGTAGIQFGSNQPQVPVEWFGAVGNGSTVDYAAIQAALNAVTAGQVVLDAKTYSIGANTLSITTSSVGIGGVSAGIPNSAQYPTPSASQILSTSATADILDVSGTSTSNNITYNRFTNFTLARSQSPGTSAAGMRLSFSYGAMIDSVVSMDSTAGFIFKGVGSQGTGYIQNSAASWGYNGFTETSGSLAGFQVDSTSGVASASIRIRDSFVAANPALTGTTTYGLLSNGSALNDLMVDHLETATVNYGDFLQATTTSAPSTDIHILNSINDGCITTCIYIQNIGGSAEISGGWDFRQSASTPVIDIRSSSHVDITNLQIYYPAGTGVGLSALGSGGLRVSHNDFMVGGGSAILLTNVTASTVTGNVANGITATNIFNIVNTVATEISSNNINGTATCGISLDATSNGNGALETNQIGDPALGAIGTLICNAGINPLVAAQGLQNGVNGSIYAIRQGVRVGGTPLCSAAANGSCNFIVTFPKAFASVTWAGQCSAETSTGAGVITAVTAPGKTTTTASVTFRDLSGSANALTSAVCEGWQ